jgi:hypothetical protein
MDLSKLPKLSQTPPPPPQYQTDTAAPPDGLPRPAAAGVELFCRCGAPINPGTNFCSNCGASYHEAVGGRGAGTPTYRARDDDAAMIGGAEAWLSIAMAAILFFLAPNAWRYHFKPASFTNTYSDAAGNPMAYTATEFYWVDLGLAAFTAVLLIEGLVLLFGRRVPALLAIALALTVAATALNVYVLARSYSLIGFQIMTAVAAAFGAYIAIHQFALLRAMRAARR